MYRCYLFGEQMPQIPSKLTLKIKGRNSTVSLLNEGEVNMLKKPGLTEITLPLVFPMLSGTKAPDYYLSLIERAVTSKKTTQFVMTRTTPDGKLLFDTNMKVSVEDYTVTEDAKNGLDLSVEIKLKQYRDYGTKTVTLKQGTKGAASSSSASSGSSGTDAKIRTGDIVRITEGAVYGGCYPPATGMKVPQPYIGNWYTVSDIQTHYGQDEALIKELYSWVALKYLAKKDSGTTSEVVSAQKERSADNKPTAKTYTVKSGDTLWGIAKTYYGDGSQYVKIYNANKSTMSNPNVLYVGQVLTIP